ncbi:unnamed protein product [Prunus brigantina]
MGVDDLFNPHGGSTTDSSHFQPTIAKLSAQVAQLLHMQTLALNLILNQDPILMTPPDPESGSYFDDPDYDDDDLDPDSDDDPNPYSNDEPDPEFVSDSDPDLDFDSNFGPDSDSDPDPNSY